MPSGTDAEVERAIAPSALRIIAKLLPHTFWAELDPSNVAIHRVGGAMTNIVFIVSGGGVAAKDPDSDEAAVASQQVLVRIYGSGTECFFDRRTEVNQFMMVAACGLGPHLLGEFANGRLEEVLDAATLSAKDMRVQSVSVLIAQKMRMFHRIIDHATDCCDDTPILWSRIERWRQQVSDMLAGDTDAGEKLRRFCDGHRVDLHAVSAAVERIKRLAPSSPVVFAHNDLQFANIMMEGGPSGQGVLHFVDFEYSSANFRAYDIANHFCEWCYDYYDEREPHRFNHGWFPSRQEQLSFLAAYCDCPCSESELEALRAEVLAYVPASHALWGYWGLLQTAQAEGIDFDFAGYTAQRLEQLLKQ